MKIFLIGMMGAGKTTIGRRLARRLGVAYLDSDAEVERCTGRSVPEIWRTDGEAAFRAEEARVLAEGVAAKGSAVVAVAGGAVLEPANRELLAKGGRVVWLRADPETLAARVGEGAGRPLLDGDPAGALRRLDAVRRPLYASLADVVIDVEGMGPDQVVDRILAAVGQGADRA